MAALFVLPVLAAVGFALLVAFLVIGLVFKVALRLILLPLLLLKWLIAGTVFFIVGPILLVLAGIVAFALVVTFSLPLLPLVALGAIILLIVRSNRRPVVV